MHCTAAGITPHCFQLGACNKKAAECDSPNVLSKYDATKQSLLHLRNSEVQLSRGFLFFFLRTTNMMRQTHHFFYMRGISKQFHSWHLETVQSVEVGSCLIKFLMKATHTSQENMFPSCYLNRQVKKNKTSGTIKASNYCSLSLKTSIWTSRTQNLIDYYPYVHIHL